MVNKVDIFEALTKAVVEAIVRFSSTEGNDISVIKPAQVLPSLMAVIGMLVEANPTFDSEEVIGEFCAAFGEQLERQIIAMRNHYKRTGQRVWDTLPSAFQ